MGDPHTSQRRAWRRTDDFTAGTPKLRLVTEDLPELGPMKVLIKAHAVSLNYRDANISNGGNPWPVIPHGIICNDAAGEVCSIGENVKSFRVGDKVAPNTDTKYITERSTGRSWLAANEDGVLADYVVYDEEVLSKLPSYLPWEQACLIPCAGVTAWTAMRNVGIGKSVLIQGEASGLCRNRQRKVTFSQGLVVSVVGLSSSLVHLASRSFLHLRVMQNC